MSTIRFTETKLSSTGKQGIIKPDADGYYDIVIGGLNVLNSAGEYYVYNGAKELFEQSSTFMRRVKNGCLRGELGHPKLAPGMSTDDFIQRILRIEETNTCVHYADIVLDTDYGKNNPKFNNPYLVAVIGKIKPSGPKATALESAINNPKENVCFSIRALTKDTYSNGRNNRMLVQIVTWDHVIEPGISIANKWDSNALESLSEVPVTMQQLETIAETTDMTGVAFESCAMAKETLKLVSLKLNVNTVPKFAQW
jgi:hypothetical protein